MIGRRELIAKVAAMTGLGNPMPSRFPYEDRPQPSPGIGPSPGQVIRARVVIVSGAGGGIFVYNGTPGPGNVPIGAFTSANADPFANSIRPGDATAGAPLIVLGTAPAGGTQSFVELVPGSPAQILLGTGDVAESQAGQLTTVIASNGPARQLATIMRAPRVSGENVGAACSVVLESPNVGLTQPPVLSIVVSDGTTTSTFNALPSAFNFNQPLELSGVAAPATQAGTVALWANSTSTSLQSLSQSGFTGDLPAVQTDTGPHTANAASLQSLTKSWPIPGNDAQAGTIYRLTCGGYGTQATTTAVNMTSQLTAFGNGFSASQNAAAQMPAGATFHWEATYVLVIVSTGVSGKARSTGSITWSQAVTGGTDNTSAGGQTSSTDITIDTTAAATIAMQASWASITNAPTMTGIWSILERL